MSLPNDSLQVLDFLSLKLVLERRAELEKFPGPGQFLQPKSADDDSIFQKAHNRAAGGAQVDEVRQPGGRNWAMGRPEIGLDWNWTDQIGYRLIKHGGSSVAAVEFVGLHDAVELPVAPVDPVLEDRHRERISDVGGIAEDQAAVRAVEIDAADGVHFGVDPVEAALQQIQRDPVGPFQMAVDEDLSVRSIHPAALDFRVHAPIRPVHPSN